MHCSAAALNCQPAHHPAARQVYYKGEGTGARGASQSRTVSDAFGTTTLRVGQRYVVCVPASD